MFFSVTKEIWFGTCRVVLLFLPAILLGWALNDAQRLLLRGKLQDRHSLLCETFRSRTTLGRRLLESLASRALLACER